MSISPAYADDLSRIIREPLYTREQIDERYVEMAVDLRQDYRGQRLLLAGVGLGGVIPTKNIVAELQRQDPKFRFDLAYVTASTYRAGSVSEGETEIINGIRPTDRMRGADIRWIDDILDKGKTRDGLNKYAMNERYGANSSDLIPLVVKNVPEREGDDPKIYGFIAPDEWLLGEGLDWRGYGRNLGYIAIMDQAAALALELERGWVKAA